MRPLLRCLAIGLFIAACGTPRAAFATDVDGPNDCVRNLMDFGDAPESVLAYPGIPGAFPTCLAAGPVGTRTVACPPISTLPGPAGYVRHVQSPSTPPYWLGCNTVPSGIDSEPDGKMNATGAAFSACATGLAIDCVEAAFGMSFGQDECYGTDDACLTTPLVFSTCTSSTVGYEVWNCGTQRQVFLNILVDWNTDGDWNDNFQCVGACAYEWAVKNIPVTLGPGCNLLTSPAFLAGPNAGKGWLRITISDTPVIDDFPWAGVATTAGQQLRGGETEDYPVTIQPPHNPPCPDYEDWGDAPEATAAYPLGVMGHFPTCLFASAPGTQTSVCAPISTPPVATGYVRHLSGPNDPYKFWLGCGVAALGTNGVDSEVNGKMNSTGAPASFCATPVAIDCVEAAFGMSFGQDECYGDPPGDAGIASAISFVPCATSSVTFKAFNCLTDRDVFLNICVDWNADGDWNDNFSCSGPTGTCAYEWPVKNMAIVLPAGCTTITSPTFLAGPMAGNGWMRVTLTPVPVTDDFPWRGSAPPAAGGTDYYNGGETEDYPVTIANPDSCLFEYHDFGDAPEGIPAYPPGMPGHFPTCTFLSAPGTQELECGTPRSTAPGPTGYVEHVGMPTDANHFWLGCGTALSALAGLDGEMDGKVNIGGPAGSPSSCASFVTVDCAEAIFMMFGQDECYGTPDAALGSPVSFMACSTGTVKYDAYNCGTQQSPAYLNILVDWNSDADWNDNLSVLCSKEVCAYEWAVKNVPIMLSPGCATYTSPVFATGPKPGYSWMRLTISRDPAPDDFPWNGSVTMPGSIMPSGETEDYQVMIVPRTTGVDDGGGRQGGLWLAPPVPNPARDAMAIRYQLPRESDVSLAVYDLAGRKVTDLTNGRAIAGPHTMSWDFRDASGRQVAAGHYVIKLRVGDTVLTRRAIRVK